jgi:predicted amidohydrolase
VVAGVTERDGERLYNAAVMLGPNGAILARHRKINELDIATGLYSIGDRLHATETSIGKVGLTICADNSPDALDIARALGRMGARLFPSPCAWAVDADHDNQREPYGSMWLCSYRQIARDYAATIVGVSNVGPMTSGPWAGRKCIGCSLAVGPGGEVLAQAPYNEECLATFEMPTP